MENQIKSVLEVPQLAERLKFELRHSYTSSGRQEALRNIPGEWAKHVSFDNALPELKRQIENEAEEKMKQAVQF